MSNFKSGSGNLDFGSSDTKKDDDTATAETTQTHVEGDEDPEPTPADQPTSASQDGASSDLGSMSDQPASDRVSTEESTASESPVEQYPYFVRRSNVGDERDTRLEIHVRDKVANQEATFRNELAEQLGASEVSKTDAREFALLAAFHHPERVAELMRDEGFGALG
ncbi:acyl-CoA dehydrogenase [Halomarina pelagica]|uniref:acyl-CoA dehydrogenase n=1 Tax=Halomarina pelagica TaxID=2961599 RepID=UPI0020C3757B|nr:acyl-CoA dehydrogenase [Halomarina sp. BND7]